MIKEILLNKLSLNLISLFKCTLWSNADSFIAILRVSNQLLRTGYLNYITIPIPTHSNRYFFGLFHPNLKPDIKHELNLFECSPDRSRWCWSCNGLWKRSQVGPGCRSLRFGRKDIECSPPGRRCRRRRIA